MAIIHYLIIALLLILAGCGCILYLIMQFIKFNISKLSDLNNRALYIFQEAHEISDGLKVIGNKLDKLDLQSDISQSICEFSKVVENIRIPVIRLETHPFKVNVTKDIQARWIKTRQEKIKMIEQQMMTAEELLNYREKLQQEYLVADRMAKKDDAILLKAKIEAVETVMGVKI